MECLNFMVNWRKTVCHHRIGVFQYFKSKLLSTQVPHWIWKDNKAGSTFPQKQTINIHDSAGNISTLLVINQTQSSANRWVFWVCWVFALMIRIKPVRRKVRIRQQPHPIKQFPMGTPCKWAVVLVPPVLVQVRVSSWVFWDCWVFTFHTNDLHQAS